MEPAVVDVWLLPRPTALPPLTWLDDAERRRAAALPPDRAVEFVAARRLLRAVLGRRFHAPPGQVRLIARCSRCGGPHGQVRVVPGPKAEGRPGPDLAAAGVVLQCHVSISRAGPLIAVATAELPVGVDVESVDAVSAAPVADVALSAAERDRHSLLPRKDRPTDLARTWARKEAVLKVLGTGLELDPSSFTVTCPVTAVDAPGGALAVAVADLAPGSGGDAASLGAGLPRESAADGEVAGGDVREAPDARGAGYAWDAENVVGAVAVVGAARPSVRVHDGGAVLARASWTAARTPRTLPPCT
ncbi:4'-phosphopantetheinyl transferase superfamily protein [Georgenia sp. EYE_87]|uniref:4'-phosphopantetheinyl transferase family protein n=1 Tax=Georgenia sp. EYE_87 TaxID=2853448 RepID=UPI00200485E5|nr:4'-phosphopantetheinyl transferase superfamily protein [Georgenia sp. EYE_87]MCK6209669.1 4'-phosphopantetheinyl transferase superfamily protein [Georgenia sp. EYE_87]